MHLRHLLLQIKTQIRLIVSLFWIPVCRKNGKGLDSTHTVDNHKFLSCLVLSLEKILNLRLADNTNMYFVYMLLYKGFRYLIESIVCPE